MESKADSVREMNFTRKASMRELIAEEAAEWFVANREGLDATQSAAFNAWLKAAPRNIEEYLNIALIGRDLRAASDDPTVSFEDLMKQALESESPVAIAKPAEATQSASRSARLNERRPWRPQRWLPMTAAAIGVVTLAFLLLRYGATIGPDRNSVAYQIQTRHGEQVTRQLPDSSVVKLDTDTEVSVQFDRKQRSVQVLKGRAEFKVAHELTRKFLVQAGAVAITDVGTVFHVFAQPDSTVVTVLEGRVAVAVNPRPGSESRDLMPTSSYSPVEVAAGQQIRVDDRSWPPVYTPVDAQRATAWLRRQIVFQNEPLEQVAAEFNRYSATPIKIDSPALRTLGISGVFAADDTESFIAFLRSLDQVQVEVTSAEIRVSRK